MVVVTDTANWSGASMSNGTSKWTPYNTETTMVINGYAQEKASGTYPTVGMRFVSDFLAGLRRYDYQQACPYPDPHTGKAVRSNCAFNHTGHQPDWIQPNATIVTRDLAAALGPAWPSVTLDLSLSNTPKIKGVVCKVSIPGWDAFKALTVAMTASKGGKLTGVARGVPLGADVAVEVFGEEDQKLGSFSAIADAAFDWQRHERQGNAALQAMRLSVHYDMPTH